MTNMQRVDSELFRNVISHFTSGVTIITTEHEGEKYGITASAVASLSLDPPSLIVCVNQQTGTCHAISKTKKFAVNILHEGQGELAFKFARPQTDKFDGTAYEYGELDIPVLNDALAHVECNVIEEVVGGTHKIFIGEVSTAGFEDKEPLAYYRGKFGYFKPYENERAYREIRKRILERSLPVDSPINVAALQREYDVPTQVIHYTLAKLEGEGLVSQTENSLYVINPLNVELLNEVLDTRAILEISAIEKTVGNLTKEELSELRKRVEHTALKDNNTNNASKYTEANISLHDYTVALAKNPTLLNTYRRLTAETVMSYALQKAIESNNPTARAELTTLYNDHVELLEAYEENDVEKAKKVIIRHTEEAKKLGKYLISSAGGSL